MCCKHNGEEYSFTVCLPKESRKIKFVWAVSNYYLSSSDKDRIKAEEMALFDDDSVDSFVSCG